MIYIGCPIWRYFDVRAAHSLNTAIAMRDPEERVYWETIDGDALISRTRSQLATKFLMDPECEGADVMVILDDDVQFMPEDLWKIVALARKKQQLAGGIYVTREREPHMASLCFPNQEIVFGPNQDPVQVRYLATGFMAIPRCVFNSLLAHPGFETAHGKEPLSYCQLGVGEIPMWDFFRPFTIKEEDGRIHYLSEDWAFCERAKQCGFEVWVDPTIILQHRAYVSVTVHDLPTARKIPLPMLSKEAAPGRGRSVLSVGEDKEEASVGTQQKKRRGTR